MSDRYATLIINPRAGRGSLRRRALAVDVFRRTLEARGVLVETHHTCVPGDATRLAAEAITRGVCEIIVAGGDGTINEALQAIVGADGVRLGVWARGTANVLARELKLPSNPEAAAAVIAAGHMRALRVGCATAEATGARRHFFLMAGVGLDASIVQGVRANLKRRVGEAAFWYAGLAHLARWRPITFNVEACGTSHTATFAAIGKASRYGGNLAITPGARLDESAFQLCVVASRSRRGYLRLLVNALGSGIAEATDDARLISTTLVRATGNALVQLDGELAGALPMTFEIAPQPIIVFAPY